MRTIAGVVQILRIWYRPTLFSCRLSAQNVRRCGLRWRREGCAPDVGEDDETDVGAGEGENGPGGYAGGRHEAHGAAHLHAGDGEEEVDEGKGERIVERVALEQDLVAQYYQHAARHVDGGESDGAQRDHGLTHAAAASASF